MSVRLTRHARDRARQRRIPLALALEVYADPDDVRPSKTSPGREIRRRAYDDQVIEIVVDLVDGAIVSVWRKGSF
jgi:hypothetical protein